MIRNFTWLNKANTKIMKTDIRVRLLGEIDELNSLLGWVVSSYGNAVWRSEQLITGIIENIQLTLGELYGQLSLNLEYEPDWEERHKEFGILIEKDLTSLTDPARGYIVPGGSESGARLHLARTKIRSLERTYWLFLSEFEENKITEDSKAIGNLLNRLSIVLWMLARIENRNKEVDPKYWSGIEDKNANFAKHSYKVNHD